MQSKSIPGGVCVSHVFFNLVTPSPGVSVKLKRCQKLKKWKNIVVYWLWRCPDFPKSHKIIFFLPLSHCYGPYIHKMITIYLKEWDLHLPLLIWNIQRLGPRVFHFLPLKLVLEILLVGGMHSWGPNASLDTHIRGLASSIVIMALCQYCHNDHIRDRDLFAIVNLRLLIMGV